MFCQKCEEERLDLDLPVGILMGLLAGAAVGILFAPKPGKELQGDIQDFVHSLPEEINEGLSKSKVKYKEIIGKTKDGIAVRMEQHQHSKRARRMAQAKFKYRQEAAYEM